MDYEKKYNEALEQAKKELATCGSMDCDAARLIFRLFPQLRESEDERIRNKIIWLLQQDICPFPDEEAKQMIAYLKKQKEQKPVEWSEEDEAMIKSILFVLESYVSKAEREQNPALTVTYPTYYKEIAWLKSLRPQPREEIYHAAKHDLAIRFMNYLDENRPEGKMGLSNGECEDIDKAFKENDWAKIMRYVEKYSPSWKPSEDEERLINTSISFLKDFADKGYENAVECIDWLKSKLNGNTCK